MHEDVLTLTNTHSTVMITPWWHTPGAPPGPFQGHSSDSGAEMDPPHAVAAPGGLEGLQNPWPRSTNAAFRAVGFRGFQGFRLGVLRLGFGVLAVWSLGFGVWGVGF